MLTWALPDTRIMSVDLNMYYSLIVLYSVYVCYVKIQHSKSNYTAKRGTGISITDVYQECLAKALVISFQVLGSLVALFHSDTTLFKV